MSGLVSDLREQTERALWEVGNVLDCLNDALWDAVYCGAPAWQHAYHMLHSLDRWYINPCEYRPSMDFREELSNLDQPPLPDERLSRADLKAYEARIAQKLRAYLDSLTDVMLSQCPAQCDRTRLSLIIAQMRHLHSHMGMLMGFIIRDTGQWPTVLGATRPFPAGSYDRYC